MNQKMEVFWSYINRKPVRLFIAAICVVFMMQGIYRVQVAQTDLMLFRGGGEILLWGGWALVNILRAFNRQAGKLHIATNVGIAMILISLFMKP